MRKPQRFDSVAQFGRATARINEEVGSGPVRLVAEDGRQLGVMSAEDARAYAYGQGLDLVEVAGSSDPPVCRAMDYGKWRYDEERRLRASRRNQSRTSFKELRLRPKIGAHDYQWKRDQALAFLRAGSKVKLVVLFRGREREPPERGRDLALRFAEDVREHGLLESAPVFEGRSLTAILAPRQ